MKCQKELTDASANLILFYLFIIFTFIKITCYPANFKTMRNGIWNNVHRYLGVER